jgi:Xaa-Pro dipeptidase
MVDRTQEVRNKIEIVRRYLEQQGAGGLYVERAENYAWLTGGIKNYVTMNSIQTECGLLVTPDSVYSVSPHSEEQRLLARLPPGVFECVTHDWDIRSAAAAAGLVSQGTLLHDGEAETEEALKGQRIRLDENERQRLAELGPLAAGALEAGLLLARPEQAEHEVAAQIAYELLVRGVEPVLVLVSGEASFCSTHHISGERPVGRICDGIVCAKRAGLVVSLTRMLAFQRDEELGAQMRISTAVDAAVIDATRHAETLGEAFARLVEVYQEHGLAQEWKKLHQGGIAGYKLKEVFASRDSRVPLRPGMAFAWNITISGTKSEDTYLLDESGMRWITRSPDSPWPLLAHEVGGRVYERPGIMLMD